MKGEFLVEGKSGSLLKLARALAPAELGSCLPHIAFLLRRAFLYTQ